MAKVMMLLDIDFGDLEDFTKDEVQDLDENAADACSGRDMEEAVAEVVSMWSYVPEKVTVLDYRLCRPNRKKLPR